MKNYKHKWKYNKEDKPLGCCYDCRMKYGQFPDMVIPEDLWEKISPSYEGGGLLCPTCIANRLSYLGFWYKDDLFQLQRKDIDEITDFISFKTKRKLYLRKIITDLVVNNSAKLMKKTTGYTSQIKNNVVQAEMSIETIEKYIKILLEGKKEIKGEENENTDDRRTNKKIC